MNDRRRRKLIAVPFALALALLALPAAPDEPADAGEDAAPAEDAGDDAAPAAEVPEPSLYLAPPPDAKSKPPTVKEWEAEKDLQLARGDSSCTARRVREWMRVRCQNTNTSSIEVVAGKSAEVFFSIVTGVDCMPDPDQGEICSEQVEAVFALRRGDRRVLQISRRVAGGYGPFMPEPEGVTVISETWLEGDPGPAVSIGRSL